MFVGLDLIKNDSTMKVYGALSRWCFLQVRYISHKCLFYEVIPLLMDVPVRQIEVKGCGLWA